MPLPLPGDLNWGLPLNDYILNEVMALAQDAADDVAAHLNSGADPHGAKAYTDDQISGITATYDQPNGRAGLGGDGRLKPSQAPTGGGRASIYDVVGDFGAVANGSDQTVKFQNALDAAASAGGGEVWVGDGVFTISGTLKIGANTHLHLSNGATIKRANNSVATAMIRNYDVNSNDAGYGGPGEIIISGGNIDGGGINNALKVNPISFAHANNIVIRDVTILNTVDNPAITVAGCRNVVIDNVKFQGLRISNPGVANGNWRQPAVNMDHTNSGSMGTGGLYDNTPCENVHIQNCTMKPWGTFKSFGKIVDSRNYAANVGHKRLWVTDNYIVGAHEYAIMVIGVFDAVIRGNTIVDSNGALYAAVPESWSYGGVAGVLNSILVDGNRVQNSGLILSSEAIRARVIHVGGINSGSSSGLYRNVTITNNQILSTANNYAIEVYYNKNYVISNNNVDYCSNNGIVVTASNDGSVTGNMVDHASGIPYVVRSGSRTVTMSGNASASTVSSTALSVTDSQTLVFAVGNRWDKDSSAVSGSYKNVSDTFGDGGNWNA